jgi:hypothetical protein
MTWKKLIWVIPMKQSSPWVNRLRYLINSIFLSHFRIKLRHSHQSSTDRWGDDHFHSFHLLLNRRRPLMILSSFLLAKYLVSGERMLCYPAGQGAVPLTRARLGWLEADTGHPITSSRGWPAGQGAVPLTRAGWPAGQGAVPLTRARLGWLGADTGHPITSSRGWHAGQGVVPLTRAQLGWLGADTGHSITSSRGWPAGQGAVPLTRAQLGWLGADTGHPITSSRGWKVDSFQSFMDWWWLL